MQRKSLTLIPVMAACLLLCMSVMVQAVGIELVPVGDAGNAADTQAFGLGAVAYDYQISKYEVTAGQYAEFLNKKAKSDPYGLWNAGMVGAYSCNITRSGTAGNYTYSVSGDQARRPVNAVTYWSAVRFVNWLHNGQGNGDTETGAYTLDGYNSTDGSGIARNTGWLWAIPTENEWWKGAHYKGGGLNAGYWIHQTQSDTFPSNQVIDPDPGNNATYYDAALGYTNGTYFRTEVGEHENSESAYGTFDQGGNVWEYTEGLAPGTPNRYRHGGAWGYYGTEMINRLGDHAPTYLDWYTGFRVVADPSVVTVLPGNIEVNVSLEDYSGDLSLMRLYVELLAGESVAAGTTVDLSSTSMTVNFLDMAPGTYTVKASAPKWETTTAPVQVVSEGNHTVSISLPNGDADGVDGVNTTDLSVVLKNVN